MIGLIDAGRLLMERFGEHVCEPYVLGKTLFRDTLCDEAQLSQLEAETLCDSLERTGILRFTESDAEGSEWVVSLPGAVA
ncbi:MAG TPA: hypothetical protein VLM85_04125 [Polyangiaceae bacterium]|nr:hypothetical protein [Polyangiaceae bacterium]